MRITRAARVSAVGLATVLGTGVALAQAGLGPAERWGQVVACVVGDDADQRHACIDGVLRAAGVLDPVREQAQRREEFGRTERQLREQATPPAPVAVPAPVPVPVPTAAPTTAASPTSTPPPPPPPPPVVPDRIDSITTTIAAARIAANGRLLVATAEATVWRQLDGEAFRVPPSAGTAFAVRRGALGSYVCTVGRANSFRCARVD